jgi:DNA-directed RNA polymerase specialized sigma24 family protein
MASQMRSSEASDSYEAVLVEENDVWLIEAVGLQGVRSFGRTIASAVANIREAIAAAEDLDEWGELHLVISVGDETTTAALDRFREAKRNEESASAERHAALKTAILALRAEGLSYRDIGAVIGMSHQRVAQLDSEAHV